MLNKMLQAALNPATPDKKERAFGDIIFREGDRVMQIRNNYDILWKKTDGSAVGTGIFNGDVGTITGIDTRSQKSGQRVPGCDFNGVERFAVSAQPQHSLHRHHPGERTADYCRS